DHAIAPGALCIVEGCVGRCQHRRERVICSNGCYSGAYCELDGLSILRDDQHLHICADAFSDGGCVVHRRLRQQYSELLAPKPANDITSSYLNANSCCDGWDHRIAGGVSEPVVDRCEIVDVEHHQADRAAI